MSDPLIPIDEGAPATRRPPWLLVAAAAVAAALWLLIALASQVRGGGAPSFDRSIMQGMRVGDVPIGPGWLPSAMRDMTALGGGPVLTLVVIVAAAFLLLKHQWRTAGLVVVATASGGLAIAQLKHLFGRARPDLFVHLADVTSPSFPSGHAGNSAIVYLTIATLLFPVVRDAAQRVLLLVAAIAIVTLVGISRVYLGVHWPSDVIAGWVFGALWALLWWGIAARLR